MHMQIKKIVSCALFTVFITNFLVATPAWAQDQTPTQDSEKSKTDSDASSSRSLDQMFRKAASTGKPTRSRMIDFEDSVVEGVNKQPWDSLNSIQDRGASREGWHLYKKRGGFGPDILEQLVEARLQQ